MKFDFKSRCFVGAEQLEKPALVSHNQVTTWRQLNNQVAKVSTKLAHLSGANLPVVILGHKQHDFVITILACVQLGVPYVPLDIIYPKERIALVLRHLGQGELINLETGEWSRFNHGACSIDPNISDLMYILFTSGSTGIPKGVQITYSAFLDYWEWASKELPMDGASTVLNQSLFTFDVSMMDVSVSMGHGGTLLLIDRAIYRDFKTFFSLLAEYKCTDWVSTPSFITSWLLSKEFTGKHLPSLRHFTFIGEVLLHRIADELINRFGDGCVYNSYGPTEATIAVSVIKIDREIISKNPRHLPIGYPKVNSGEIIILDKQGKQTDQEGEIIICGDNVSIGYLDTELTANSAFFQWKGMRAYRTGDYGYFRDGVLYYSGREDDQVKLNGFRIEILEIEKQITKIEHVVVAAVIPLKRDEKVIRLIAFVFMEDDRFITEGINVEIKEKLAKFLPSYMIPSEIICSIVGKIPYNSSNKIDRKYLRSGYQSNTLEGFLGV